MVQLTPQAWDELSSGDVLVFDWHRVAICCAAAGEVSLRRTSRAEVERSRSLRQLGGNDGPPVYAHPWAYPHLVGRPITIDCRRRLGFRHFTSDLPADFGLRASLGRLPDPAGGGKR